MGVGDEIYDLRYRLNKIIIDYNVNNLEIFNLKVGVLLLDILTNADAGGIEEFEYIWKPITKLIFEFNKIDKGLKNWAVIELNKINEHGNVESIGARIIKKEKELIKNDIKDKIRYLRVNLEEVDRKKDRLKKKLFYNLQQLKVISSGE